ncbi:MAG: hypothetical protein WCK98_03450 [bacterium]
MYKNIFKLSSVLSLLVFTLTTAVLYTNNVNVAAQKIGIKPFNIDGSQRGVFRYQANSGDKIEDSAVVTNGSEFAGDAIVKARDSLVDSGGQISFIENSAENLGPAKWLSVSQEKLNVPAGQGIKVPFTIQIPSDTKSGEYTAGIVAGPAASNTNLASGGVDITVRTGITIYITVKGDLRLDANASDLVALNPTQPNFAVEINNNGSVTPENMVIKFNAKNNGNVYTVLDLKIRIDQPDGKGQDFTFSRNLNLGNQNKGDIYYETRIPYQVGQTKIKLDYDSRPYNFSDLKFSKSDTSKGTLEYTMNLTQDDIAKFKTVKAAADTFNKPVTPVNTSSSSSSSDATVNNVAKSEDKKTDDNKGLIYTLAGIGGAVILALIGVIVFLVMKNKKKDDESDMDKKPATMSANTPSMDTTPKPVAKRAPRSKK